jgi:predicted nucleic acid-binding protein
MFVFDAWALLAFLQGEEPAATRVRQLLQARQQSDGTRLFLSAINLGEGYYIIGRSQGEQEALKTLLDIQRLPLTILSATDERVFAAAGFKIRHRLSYADAFAAAAAAELKAILVTGDPELLALTSEIRLERVARAGQ